MQQSRLRVRAPPFPVSEANEVGKAGTGGLDIMKCLHRTRMKTSLLPEKAVLTYNSDDRLGIVVDFTLVLYA